MPVDRSVCNRIGTGGGFGVPGKGGVSAQRPLNYITNILTHSHLSLPPLPPCLNEQASLPGTTGSFPRSP